MPNQLSRLTWHIAHRSVGRSSKTSHHRWTRDELERLASMVGKHTPFEMTQALNCTYSALTTQLRRLGYKVSRDVVAPLGLNGFALAHRLHLNYSVVVWRDIRSGVLPARKMDRKQFLITWADVAKYEKRLAQLKARRQRVLDRITEPTISKQQFMKLMGLCETQVTRYLQYGVVRGWKIPCANQFTPRRRWDWVVSRADALRVKNLRESGKLRFPKRFRNHVQANSVRINELRHQRRLGLRPISWEHKCVIEGWYTVVQVARMVNLSEQSVHTHIDNGRLRAKAVKCGRRHFLAIEPTQIPAYVTWCQRLVKATGPIQKGLWSQRAAVRVAGYLTIRDAAHKYGIHIGSLCGAVTTKRIPSTRIDGMRAVRDEDAARFASTYTRRKFGEAQS